MPDVSALAANRHARGRVLRRKPKGPGEKRVLVMQHTGELFLKSCCLIIVVSAVLSPLTAS